VTRIERETAELAVAVAATRGQTATQARGDAAAHGGDATAFPSARIMLDGWMENAAAVGTCYRGRGPLPRDPAGPAAPATPPPAVTLDGPHLTDLQVIYAPKSMPARDCLYRRAKGAFDRACSGGTPSLVAEMTGITPLLLLDEVGRAISIPPGAWRCSMSWRSSARRSG